MAQRPFTQGSLNPFRIIPQRPSNHRSLSPFNNTNNKPQRSPLKPSRSTTPSKILSPLRSFFFIAFLLSFLIICSIPSSYTAPPPTIPIVIKTSPAPPDPPPAPLPHTSSANPTLKMLHVVTSLTEFQTGTRGTTQGVSRLTTILLPTLLTTVSSISNYFPANTDSERFEVHVHLVLGYTLTSKQKDDLTKQVKEKGAKSIDFTEDAVPYGINSAGEKVRTKRSLARQHRYVVQDKLDAYDFFSAWEDDMMIKSGHIVNFRANSAKLEKVEKDTGWKDEGYMIPGFLRVEVLDVGGRLDGLLDSGVRGGGKGGEVDTKICCESYIPHVSDPSISSPSPPPPQNTTSSSSSSLPQRSHLLVLWESSIASFRLTKLPTLNAVIALLPIAGLGRNANKHKQLHSKTTWAYDESKISAEERGSNALFSQQAGWMLSKSQILRINDSCNTGNTGRTEKNGKGFLPEFTGWPDNGAWQNVEFWSGGFQLFGTACQVQRVLFLGLDGGKVEDGEEFGAQLVWHTGNNKQRSLPGGWVADGYGKKEGPGEKMRFSGVDFGGVGSGGGLVAELRRRREEVERS